MTYAPALGRSLSVQSSANSVLELSNILNAVKHFSNCSDAVVKNLGVFAHNKEVILECKVLDYDAKYWDGELIIHITKGMNARQIINYVVSGSYADEIRMLDNKTLRLWWD